MTVGAVLAAPYLSESSVTVSAVLAASYLSESSVTVSAVLLRRLTMVAVGANHFLHHMTLHGVVLLVIVTKPAGVYLVTARCLARQVRSDGVRVSDSVSVRRGRSVSVRGGVTAAGRDRTDRHRETVLSVQTPTAVQIVKCKSRDKFYFYLTSRYTNIPIPSRFTPVHVTRITIDRFLFYFTDMS